jgi:ABC-type bacteriocin/lantibiotic exporter with double-glycine peptidase domain
MIKLEYPTSRQDNYCSCGSAAVQSMLRYYGIDEVLDSLSDELKMDDNGISYKNIIKLFKKRKLEVEYGTMNRKKLKEYIDRKIPVIILIQAYKNNENQPYTINSYKDGHYVTVIGYSTRRFIIEDPSLNNELGYINNKDFDIRWHGLGENKDEKLIFLE